MKAKLIILSCLLVLMLIPVVLAGTVTRSVSDSSPTSGDLVTVTLTIDTVAGDRAIAIHEEAPGTILGLTDNVYETALVDQIRVDDTTRVYQFTAGATGTQFFSGKYTTNGVNEQQIGGVTSINVGGQCVPGAWTPDPSTVCDGDTFTQNDGCDGTRSVTGTSNDPACSDDPICGNNQCEAGETVSSCAEDCTNPPVDQSCSGFEKKNAQGSCDLNTSLIVMLVVGLIAMKIFKK